MPETTAQPPSTPAGRRVSRRWWRRALKWLAWTTAILVIAGLAAWHWRVELANAALKRVSPDFPVRIGGLEWERGGLQMKDVTVSDDKGGRVMTLPSGHVELGPFDAAKGKFGKIKLDGPVVELGPEFWKQLAAASKAEKDGDETPSNGSLFSAEGIEIRGARIRAATAAGESITGELDWTGGGAAVFGDGGMDASHHTIRLRNVRAVPAGDADDPALDAADFMVDFSLSRDNRKLVIHELKAEGWKARGFAAVWETLGLSSITEAPPPSAAIGAAPAPSSTRSPVESIAIEDVQISPLEFQLESLPWLPGFPAIRGRLSAQGGRFSASIDGGARSGQLQLTLEDVVAGGDRGQPLARLSKLRASFSDDGAGNWRMDRATLDASQVHLVPEVAASLPLPPGLPIPFIDGVVRAELAEWRISGDGFTTAAPQKIALENFAVSVPGGESPLAAWKNLTVEAVPDEVVSARRLRRLFWDAPQLSVTGRELAYFNPPNLAEETPRERSNADSPPEDGRAAWEGWRVDELIINEGTAGASGLGPGIPDVSANFRAEMATSDKGTPLHQVALEQIRVSTPDLPRAPALYRGQTLQVQVDPEKLWKLRQIESVAVTGSRVHAGAGETDWETPDEMSGAPPASIHTAPQNQERMQPTDWHVRRLTLANTKVYLHSVLPDVAEILIPVGHKTFTNIPITAEGLAADERPERIELPLVYIPGTRAGATVMDLDTNFVQFSLAGLMRQEVESVELVNPKIYVGDSLFHYVDKIRTEQKTAVASQISAEAVLGSLISLITEGEPPPPDGWNIKRLRAMNGKLISTVKDSPMIRVPAMPFGADSSLAEGKINADLAVPPGIYKPVLGMDLVVSIAEGRVAFNLPSKGESNNLVQVFKADWLRYEQFRIADVSLSVTFDANGIYAKFWAKGYGGDLEGAFNLYLDDNMSWDMWVAGAKVDIGQITQKHCPEYFTMTGAVDFKLIAQGDRMSLYQATGSWRNRSDGRLRIVALDDVIKGLPKEWNEAQIKWVTKALETVRDFSYKSCVADLRFNGLDGTMNLRLKGPDGSRNFQVRSHDRRLR